MAEKNDGKRSAEHEPEGAPAEKRTKVTIQLFYMPIRGLGEDIRLLLTDQGVEFEDHRVGNPEFGTRKWDINPHFGQVPVLVEGDHKYLQSKAIMRHLARVHNLYGKNEQEHYHADMVAEACGDWRRKYTTLVYDSAFESKKDAFIQDLPNILTPIEKILGENHYVLGDHICYTDYILYELIDITNRLAPEVVAKFPKLLAFHHRIEQRPHIAAYLASGKRATAVNGRSASFDGLRE